MKKTKLQKIKTHGRFVGIIGAQYNKLFEALPHLLEIEKIIAKKAMNGMRGTLAKPLRVLDLGCGTGITTLAVCEIARNTSIVGIDNESVMFQQYQELMAKQKTVFQARNIVVTGYKKDALKYLELCDPKIFDVVVSGYVLHNLPEVVRHNIVMQIARVLDTKGRFVNGDKITRKDELLHQRDLMGRIVSYAKTYKTIEDMAFALGWVKHDIRDDEQDQRLTEDEFHSSLAAAGFVKVRISNRHGLDAVVVADR